MTCFRRLQLLTICIFCFGQFCSSQNPAKEICLDCPPVNDAGWEVLAQSKLLTATTREAMLSALGSHSQDKSQEALKQIASQTRIKAVDLSGKTGEEFLARGFGLTFCSPTGNCESWILRQNGDKFSVILHRGAVQTFTIHRRITRGFHDIVLGMHGSAFLKELTLYRFDGIAYRKVACYEENFQGKDGRPLDDPELTSCP